MPNRETCAAPQVGCRLRVWKALLSVALLGVAASGCDALDSILEVDLPGQVSAEDLNNPTFARTLVLSAQGDFECAFSNHVWAQGIWTNDFWVAGFTRTQNVVALRDLAVLELSGGLAEGVQPTCRQTNPPPLYMPLQTARAQASLAINKIEQWDQAELSANKDYLLGKARAYRGYSILLLAEAFCSVTIDAGPELTRAQAFTLARDDFSSAITHFAAVTSGPDLAETGALRNMALVGRARANLNLGDGTAVVADASLVPLTFVRLAERATTSTQTRNHVYDQSIAYGVSVTTPYHNLTVGGVPDPRVSVIHRGVGLGSDAVTDVWEQRKYPAQGTSIPLATGREARLMIAEVQGDSTAVNIINQLRSTYSLPSFSSSDPVAIQAQVREERRRELWLQGTRLGDMLRHNIPFVTGLTPKGEPYGSFTCMPIPQREIDANPNL